MALNQDKKVGNSTLKWEQCYRLGEALLDSQHKRLLDLCQETLECAALKDKRIARLQFRLILNDMMKYATEHFATEERLLEHYHYPQLEQHKSEHLQYFAKLTELLMSAPNGIIDMEEISRFNYDWWTQHIQESDAQLKPYLLPTKLPEP
ncbi:MAG: bacteriohemerythrin [Methylophilaceae bacterium]|nr:bacteriohemerythrin [Methylophilaceae bacterium]